jgi:hypothetical protein
MGIIEKKGTFDLRTANQVETDIKRVFKHKYGDLILLCFVAVAFGGLLFMSVIG